MIIDPNDLDDGIRAVVLLLHKAGFKTFTSCEGGRGHAFHHETVGLELDGNYRSFHKRLVKFLRSQGLERFTVSLVTDYPKGKNYVYIEGLDLLSDEKRKQVVQTMKRRERKLRRHPMLRKLGKGTEIKEELPLRFTRRRPP